MLIRNDINVISRLKIDLYFDDNSEKHVVLDEKDIVTISYNNKGVKKEITGKVALIKASSYSESYIIVDGSGVFVGNRETIQTSTILDCDLIEKYDENLTVRTVVGTGAITNLRVNNDTGIVEYSTDNGIVWKNINSTPLLER